jgi:hypothetical protein
MRDMVMEIEHFVTFIFVDKTGAAALVDRVCHFERSKISRGTKMVERNSCEKTQAFGVKYLELQGTLKH